MLRDISPDAQKKAVSNGRALRKQMTLPEILLWKELRKRPAGLKFRRQHPTGPYCLDFYCNDARLAIEIDGEAHNRGNQPGHDMVRDVWLESAGIATLRINARDVLRDLEAAIIFIVQSARCRLPLHHPAKPGGPPPSGELGEDQ